MITTPTVLILGAGASISYGFPSGLQLKAEICQATNNTHSDIYKDLKLLTNKDMVYNFYNNLLLSSEMSIDAFLEHNQSFSKIGRRAIANILLRKEKHLALFDNWINKWLDPKNEDNHWYQLLFSKLNAPFEEFEKNNLKIITFNYDRSLEYFLVKAMRAKYAGERPEDIIKKLHNIEILHIYGKLGNLPEYDQNGFYVPYDLFNKQGKEDWWREYIEEASKKIITVHQAKEEIEEIIEKARKFLIDAERIYFLGFGYDKINMKRLFCMEGRNLLTDGKIGRRCHGTAMNLSPHHKRFLAQLGLDGMDFDLSNEASGRSSILFPNSTIYDFLYYSPYSILE